MLFVEGAHEGADLLAQRPRQRHLLDVHHGHLELAGAQRRRDLEADEAAAQHHGARRTTLDGTRAQLLDLGDDGPAVGQGAQVAHVGQVAARQLETHRLGTGGEEQRAPGKRRAAIEGDSAPARVDRGHTGAELQLDPPLVIELARMERDPLLGGVAGQVVLGEIGAVVGRRVVGADERDGAGVTLAAQPLGGGVGGGAGADDDHRFRARAARGGARTGAGRSNRRRRRWRQLFANRDPVPLALHPVARHRVQRRRAQRLAGAQAEAGVVPGAAHGIADQQPLGQRSAVVGAMGSDGEDLVAVTRQQHRLAARVAEQAAARRAAGGADLRKRHSLRQVGTTQLLFAAHCRASSRVPARGPAVHGGSYDSAATRAGRGRAPANPAM